MSNAATDSSTVGADLGAIRATGLRLARARVRCRLCRSLLVYTLSTLLDRVMDQDVLGHLLVEAWASRKRSLIWSVPGADLVSADGVRREMDVLGLSRQELIVAEVKNRSTGFAGTAVEEAASLATGLGASRLLLACLDDWAEGAAATVQEAASTWFTGAVDVLGAADLLD